MSHVRDNRWLQSLDSSCCRDQLRTSVLTDLPDRMLSVSSAIWNDVSVVFIEVNILCSLLHSPTQTRTGKHRRINTQDSQHRAEKHSTFVIIGGVQIPLKWAVSFVLIQWHLCVCVCVCLLTVQFSTSGWWKGNSLLLLVFRSYTFSNENLLLLYLQSIPLHLKK